MTVAEAKIALALPDLMDRLGLGEHAQKSARCPFHDDGNNSFSVWQKDGAWFFKCHIGCGEGDEINFLEKQKGVSRCDATRLYLELARGRLRPAAVPTRRTRTKNSPSVTAPASTPVFDWPSCVSALRSEARIAKERGYSLELVSELHKLGLIGSHNGHIAFSVADNGQVVGVHYKVGDSWRYHPTGTNTRPFIIGKLIPGELVHVFESQWDAFAFMDVSGERDGIIITRGAGNGALVGDLIPGGSTAYVWTQNDETDAKGKNAGEDWQVAVCSSTTAAVKRVPIPSKYKDLNDWTRADAFGDDLLDAILNAELVQEAQPPLIEFKSPLELKNFVPPPGIILVGDCHITQGTVFVIAGAPGVGKSRGLVALGVAGATSSEWFGLPVHRPFKTMIVQTENGQFRLSREFSELDCEALENYVRICTPPPYGLCFKREDFRKQLADAIGEFKPDIVGFDPWNAAAREQDSREYLDTFDALKSVLPRGDDAPVLGIVAHTRKPKSDERHSGRSLLNLLAGSYVLGSVPRTVFVMQAASDDVTDNRVVWTCCKNNDGELGARSAWERRNGLFVPVEFFDWDAFDHPPKKKRGLRPDALREFLMRGREYDKSQLVSIVMDETGCQKSTAYNLVRAASRARFCATTD